MRPLHSGVNRTLIAFVVLLALVAVPAPLLPVHGFVRALQVATGGEWKAAYFIAATGTHLLFYGSLGVLAAFALGRARSLPAQLLQLAVMPWAVTAAAFAVRSAKLGFMPLAANALLPAVACLAGVGAGLWLAYGAWRTALAAAVIVAAAGWWAWSAVPSPEVIAATEARLRRLAAAELEAGDARFGALVEAAFSATGDGTAPLSAVDRNRAAILALGIALGDERLAALVGLPPDAQAVRDAAALRAGTTLRGRPDWVRHFTVSAALAILRNPFASEAAGLIKEQLDTLTHGSGFSFADLAADRAGVRFADAATRSEAAALALESRLARGYAVGDFFPAVDDLPEDLTLEVFRRHYGGVGHARYRQMLAEIDARLDVCPALVRSHP